MSPQGSLPTFASASSLPLRGAVLRRVHLQEGAVGGLGAAAVAVHRLGRGAAERRAGRLRLRHRGGGGGRGRLVVAAELLLLLLALLLLNAAPEVGGVRRGARWNIIRWSVRYGATFPHIWMDAAFTRMMMT